jgi:hypothetical protein
VFSWRGDIHGLATYKHVFDEKLRLVRIRRKLLQGKGVKTDVGLPIVSAASRQSVLNNESELFNWRLSLPSLAFDLFGFGGTLDFVLNGLQIRGAICSSD